jgi:hypothetical protein
MADYLKMYSIFCSNQKKAFDTVEKCKAKKPHFRVCGIHQKINQLLLQELIIECEMNPRAKGQLLGSYLIKPVQVTIIAFFQ